MVDYNIGKLVDYLKVKNKYEEMFIIFLVDNGVCVEMYDELGSKVYVWINDFNFSGVVFYGIGWVNVFNMFFYEYKVKFYEGGLVMLLILYYLDFDMYDKGGVFNSFGYIMDVMFILVELSGSIYFDIFYNR